MLAMLFIAAAAQAQTADPTRPPAAWLSPVADARPGSEGAGPLRLQSVLMRQGGRPVAVIGGKVVHAGGVPSRDKIEQWLAA